MSAEQKTSHRGFTIITVLERLSKGRARLSAKVLASDEDHKRRLGGKKLLQAKRWFDHFADDLAAPVIAGLKHTIDLELAAAAKAAPKKAAKPASAAAGGNAGKVAKVEKAAKAPKSAKPAKPAKPVKPAKAEKVAEKGVEKGGEKGVEKGVEKGAPKSGKPAKAATAKAKAPAKSAVTAKPLNGAAKTASGVAKPVVGGVAAAARKRAVTAASKASAR
ncbi:hypothetical protein [Pandoraea sputorum]|uniref:Uncharacterized protein n=1 Tax=Pandoraea sputorum TaxID=93222 RepID=A0A5E5BKD2_9BURK|nr:hypothetical protein [Pandoraea sputorum]VVE84800.1 hypothetical protein PSP31121_04939 [Pandoraea sputorum]